MFFHLY